ncbi:BTAD domain-containing putative transcriptional regulator [Actinomadura sp. 9N407]|uniref:AfsR/SARP family transcriptional regulator n=1 Tax=Actinomadura sp. 9N407 TaxID=3375154 RepID=UPI003797F143
MLAIRLLGPPAIERDGRPVRSPRGRKAWALLGYLLLAERPPSRKRLAELLFGQADDPLGALRWTLAELRRALGERGAFGGDPLIASLGDDVAVDIRALAGDDPEALLRIDGELLEGVQLESSPEFESWLSMERHRLSATVEARLHQVAIALLASGRPAEAIPYASRAVARNPLDEGNHELLVRSLAMAGDRAAARRQAAICEDILRRELGVAPSPALSESALSESALSESALSESALSESADADPRAGTATALPLSGRVAAAGQLDAGRAAIGAGAVDSGLECLRVAVAEAARCGDLALQARALAALGGALVHSLRGRDEEGAVVLHEAMLLATEAGERGTVVTAQRELGFIEVQAGRRDTAGAWLAGAHALAETDEELAAILGVRGMDASDIGDYASAFAHLHESIERAARCGDHRQRAWSLSILARAHLLRDEHAQAAVALADTLDVVRRERWMAFLPLPQTFQAEIDLRAGKTDLASEALESAWVLACRLGDPCWEGLAARGLGLLHSVRGDHGTAAAWLTEAAARCTRVPDRYQWVHAYVMDAAIATALDRDQGDKAVPMVASLAELAARCGMREFVVRAHLHRHRLGDPAALPSARLLAADIDNPALIRRLSSA